MDHVVKRSLWLLVISTAIVFASAGLGQPGTTGHEADAPAHDATVTGEHAAHADIDSEAAFIAGMIPHHEEAVSSAQQVLDATERTEMRELAQAVIATQTAEIATLEGWLESWYPHAAEASYTAMMPELTGLSASDTDRAFLTGMIEHHRGAIDMAQAYLAGDFAKHDEVIAMAEAIVNVQEAEVTQMQAWLDAWYAEHDAAGH